MSAESSRRPRAPRAYVPSGDDKEKYAQILARLTPPPTVYEAYRLQVNGYLSMVGPALRVAQPDALVAFRLRRSVLFEEREYLVAYVGDDWLGGIAPECDAISSLMAGGRGEGGSWLQLPPLVFLPQSKRRARSNAFRSVVEHEIVHVNQALARTFPEAPSADGGAEDLLDHFVARTVAEYEACFLQGVRWPTEHPTQLDVSLEHWCLLRGYSQALEHALLAVVELDVPPARVGRFFDLLASSLPAVLRRMGADAELASWFEQRLDTHLAIAMKQVMTPFPALKEHPAFRAAGLWLRPRPGVEARPQTDTPDAE